MSSAAEVEVKFHIENLVALTDKLHKSGFQLVTPRTHEMNTLYDTPGSNLRRRGELLRIRKYGDTWKVTHKAKGDIGKHKSRHETETKVEDGEALAAIFASIGLVPSFQYEKFRSEWSDGTGHVVLDETPIGNIAEIEGPPEWIDATAAKLDISHSDYITESYAQMFFAWKKKKKSSAQHMTWKALGTVPPENPACLLEPM
jgi:adenylate cyclase class 2